MITFTISQEACQGGQESLKTLLWAMKSEVNKRLSIPTYLSIPPIPIYPHFNLLFDLTEWC